MYTCTKRKVFAGDCTKKFSEQMILKQAGIIMDFANLKHGKKL